jgi:hypothetical protein
MVEGECRRKRKRVGIEIESTCPDKGQMVFKLPNAEGHCKVSIAAILS